MGESFKKFKIKSLLIALLKSAVCGLSLGLIAAGAVALALKLAGIDFAVYLYVLIGLGLALLGGGLSFLLFRQSDLKIAKNIDERYGLDEKVQTALLYASEQGAVVEMQRQQTEACLATLPKLKLGFATTLSKIWQFILAGVLAVAIPVAAIVIPAKSVQGSTIDNTVDNEEEDKPFIPTEDQFDAMLELIVNVKASDLDASLKESVVKELNNVLLQFPLLEWESDLKLLLKNSYARIENHVSTSYSYTKIATSLSQCFLYSLGKVVADGVNKYSTYKLNEYKDIKFLSETIGDEIVKLVEVEIDDAFDVITADISGAQTLIFTALVGSKVAASDPLYGILFNFARGLTDITGNLPSQLKLTLQISLEEEIARQAYIRAMKVFVFNRLDEIFGIKGPVDVPFELQDYGTGGDDGDDDDKTNSGGYGTGDWKTNLQIYDPKDGKYKNYMDLIAEYWAIVEDMLRQPDKYTKEQINAIYEYFQILYNGITDRK